MALASSFFSQYTRISSFPPQSVAINTDYLRWLPQFRPCLHPNSPSNGDSFGVRNMIVLWFTVVLLLSSTGSSTMWIRSKKDRYGVGEFWSHHFLCAYLYFCCQTPFYLVSSFIRFRISWSEDFSVALVRNCEVLIDITPLLPLLMRFLLSFQDVNVKSASLLPGLTSNLAPNENECNKVTYVPCRLCLGSLTRCLM